MLRVRILSAILICVSNPVLYAQAPPVIHWQKSLGGSGLETGKILRPTSDGGYLLGGNTTSSDGEISGFRDSVDAVAFKLDANGSIQWQKCYGGSGQDVMTDFLQTADGDYIFLCSSSSNDFDVTVNQGNLDTWIVRVDASGSIQWQKSYGGPGREGFSYSRIVGSQDGGFVISTITTANGGDVSGHHPPLSPNQDADIWVFKIDNNGNLVWQRCLGGSKSDYPGALIALTDGYIIAGGVSSSDGDVACSFQQGQYGVFWMVKLDESGNIVWKQCLNRDSGAIDGKATPDGGFIFSGSCIGPGGVSNIYLVKTDANGIKQWERSYGGELYDIGEAVLVTQDGGYVVTGNISRAEDIVCQSRGGYDIWVIRTDPQGDMLWQKSYGGSLTETAFSILETPDQGFLITGQTASVDGDINGQDRLGYTDMWLFKLGFPGIEVLPTIDINSLTSDLCPGKTAMFTATITDGGSSPVFQWQVNGVNTGANDDTLLLENYSDGYQVNCILTSNSPCVTTRTVFSDTLQISVDPLLTPRHFLPPDTIICEFGRIQLASSSLFKTYLWSNGAVTPTITTRQPGVYFLDVMNDKDCRGSDTVIVTLKADCVKGFYMPTAFTPNNDGNNDRIRPIIGGIVQQYQFTIMNRWGQVVFQTSDEGNGWDGRFRGLIQEGAVYVWTCTYQLAGDKMRVEKGTLVLLK